ncbi:alpha/beta hydrolase [Streptomyces sp. CAU 1734]|uniref:alpha/beta fold hydrolase n=1 Tax=Streptomyces sp. CAU 1734 TaxID=3140360 RepID=UPI00325FF494
MSRPPTFIPPSCARPLALHTPRGRFATLDARPRNGAARGTALLVPGFTGSKEDFIAMLEPLTDAGYRVVAVDGRGQYESPGTGESGAYEQRELAQDLLAQAEAVGDGPVHLLGHSLGGLISRAAVLLDASPFRTLTLMASGPARVTELQRQKIRLLSDALATMTMAAVWQALTALDPPEDAGAEREAGAVTGADLERRWLLGDPVQLITTGRQLSTEPDRVGELAAVQPLPKHVVRGERDETWPTALMDEMAERLGAPRTVISGAEHSPNTDRPGETAAAVAGFWDRH